jgi:hypothetical protein
VVPGHVVQLAAIGQHVGVVREHEVVALADLAVLPAGLGVGVLVADRADGADDAHLVDVLDAVVAPARRQVPRLGALVDRLDEGLVLAAPLAAHGLVLERVADELEVAGQQVDAAHRERELLGGVGLVGFEHADGDVALRPTGERQHPADEVGDVGVGGRLGVGRERDVVVGGGHGFLWMVNAWVVRGSVPTQNSIR